MVQTIDSIIYIESQNVLSKAKFGYFDYSDINAIPKKNNMEQLDIIKKQDIFLEI